MPSIELAERLVPRLLAREPDGFITSGQWMTERTGGSDVGGTSTVARFHEERGSEARYRLYGDKWFTSATDSEMALLLARIDDGNGESVPGSRGLSLFCAEVGRGPGGGLEGIRLNRLKDKLGTRALPTAELTLDGLPATRIGEPGRGVATIAPMLNLTRWHNALAAASGMARATALARDYAARRVAFGVPIAEHPLHRRTLDEMEAEAAGALLLCLEVAALLGRAEHGQATDDETARLRGLLPLLKLTTAKQAVAVASEALECFGGAGYVEDTGLPRLLRDAQVLPIWEGTTNVLALDALRAEARGGALTAVARNLVARAEALDAVDPRARADLQADLQGALGALETGAEEELGRELALLLGRAAQAVGLAEAAVGAAPEDPTANRRFQLHARPLARDRLVALRPP